MYLGYMENIKDRSTVLSELYEDDFLKLVEDPENIDTEELIFLTYRLLRDYQEEVINRAKIKNENRELRSENRSLINKNIDMEAEIAALKIDSMALKEYKKETEAAPERTRSYANVGPKAKNDYSVIIGMRKEGKNNNQIAQELGTTRQNIGRILKMWKEGKIDER